MTSFHKDYLLLAIAYFDRHPSTKLVYCKAERFGLENKNWDLKHYSYQTLLVQNIIFCSAVYRTYDYKSLTSGYDEQMLNGYEDWDFWIQLLDKDDKVHQLDKVLFYYRIKEKSTILTNDLLEISKRKYIYQKHIEKYLEYLPDPIFLAQQNELINKIYKDSYAWDWIYIAKAYQENFIFSSITPLMIEIDIIILSYAKNGMLKQLTEQTISTLLVSEDPAQIHFNIIVIESNKNLAPFQFENTKTIYPKEKFNFNKYLNIGISLTSKKYTCLCNNDLIFHKNWASEILKEFARYPTLLSANPYCERFDYDSRIVDHEECGI